MTTPASLLAEPPLRALVRLAGPTTAVMLVAALQQVLNTYFVSHLGSVAIAAVSLMFPLALILTTVVGGGIGSGVASAVARALGAGRPGDAREIAEHAFALTGGMALALSTAMLLFERPIFSAMGAAGEVLETAIAVAQIFFAGLFIPFFIGTCDSLLRGMGNVRTPAICSTLSLVLQIVFTPVFMFWLGWGIRGAPAATLAGQVIGIFPRLPFVFGRRAAVRVRLSPRRLRRGPLGEILGVGVPASLGVLVNYLGAVALTAVMARFGTAELAAYGLGSRFDFLMLTLCYGTGVAVLSLVGFAAGARRPDLAVGFVRRAIVLMVAVLTPPAVALWLYPDLWLGLFTDDPGVHAAGTLYFRILAFTYPLTGLAMTLAFAFQGFGRAFVPMLIGVARVTAIIGGAVVLTTYFGAGIRGVLLLVAATSVCSSAALAVAFQRMRRRAQLAGAAEDQGGGGAESEPTR